MSILSIDFGGTRTRVGWFSPDLDMLARNETMSMVEQPIDAVLKRIIDYAAAVVPAGVQIDAIGISAPNPQAFTGLILNAAVLPPDWQNVPLAQIISDAFGGAPVYMENDGNLAALAEYHLGAAQGTNPAVYMTISTGIGGGIVIDGRLFTGRTGLAFEPGHLKFPMADGTILSLEDFASGTALGRRASQKLAESNEPSLLRSSPFVTGKEVGAAAVQGDRIALDIIQNAGYWLGLGLVAVLHLYNPEVIVLGGSVSTLGDLILNPARAVIEKQIISADFYTPDMIRLAALGDDVCLIGAATYVRDHLYA